MSTTIDSHTTDKKEANKAKSEPIIPNNFTEDIGFVEIEGVTQKLNDTEKKRSYS